MECHTSLLILLAAFVWSPSGKGSDTLYAFVSLDLRGRIASPQSLSVNLLMRDWRRSVESKLFVMRPDMSRFKPERLLNGDFAPVMAIHFQC
jgi:hypothetical protein